MILKTDQGNVTVVINLYGYNVKVNTLLRMINLPTPWVLNLFSAAGHIYMHGFYTGQTLLKRNLSRKDCISVVPKRLCLTAQETS